ncbi:MAG: ABC transporter substrate-binding protein [Gordonia sp. (in: high G+C Gram-positive bacteria)]
MEPHFSRRRLIVPAALAVLGLALAGCSGTTGDTDTDSSTLTIANMQAITSFNPTDVADGYMIQFLQPVYETLTHITAAGEIEPGLAQSWKYTDAAQTVLDLKIRAGAQFANGDTLDAAAVAKSLTRFGAEKDSATSSIASAEAIDPTTVRVHLSAADPGLLYNFGKSAGMIVDTASDNHTLDTKPSGSGPYVLDDSQSVAGDHYTYTRNKRYQGQISYPYDKVVIKVVEDATARLNAVASGQADVTSGDSTTFTEAQSRGLTVTRSPGDTREISIIDRNGVKQPVLGDLRVRQAIAYAIDRDKLLTAADQGNGKVVSQIFNTKSQAYDPDYVYPYAYNPTKAKELLAAAGHPNGLTLTLPTNAFYPQYQDLIGKYLNDVGIKIHWVTTTLAQGAQPYTSTDFSILISSWGTSNPWVDITGQVTPNASFNPYHSTDAKVSALLSTIRTTQGAQQESAYRELSRYLSDQVWFVPLFEVDNYHLSTKSVKVTPQFGQVVPFLNDYAKS